MNLNKTDSLSLGVEVVNYLLGRLADAAHGNENVLSVGNAVVVEGLIVCAYALIDLGHVAFNNVCNSVILAVCRLACLEEGISVLSGAAKRGSRRAIRLCAEFGNFVVIYHLRQLVIFPNLDLLHLVRGAEAIKEMQERYTAFNCGKMRDRAEIHSLLRTVGAEHGIAGLTAGINIGVVSENGKGVSCQRASGYMDNGGEHLARDFIHIGYH